MDEEFHPVTGKLDVPRDTAGSSDDDTDDDDDIECASFISMPDDRSALVSSPNPAFLTYANLPAFSVETIHISCKSDAYRGSEYCYAGVIIYSCDGKSQWQTANGTRCKSGYLVIVDTETEKFKKYKQQSPGQVHGAVYRSAFGEECTAKNVNAEGFSVMNGVFKINSGVFNPAKDGYHDDKKSMHPLSASCIQKVVNSWMNARENFYECRNFMIKDLQ